MIIAGGKTPNNRMRNLKLLLAYDGTDFCGWQVQPGAPTIQGALASAIEHVTGETVLPQGSGRTDAGVHALGQVATFAIQSPIPAENLVTALNDVLPASIRIYEAAEVPADFHARKSAQAKTYRYTMFRGAICPPFRARYVWHYPYPLDEVMMQQVAACRCRRTRFHLIRRGRPGARTRPGSLQRPQYFLFHVGAPGRRIGLHRPRKRIPAPHGAQPGRHVPAGGQGYVETIRASADSCSPLPLCRRSHGTGKRPVPAERRVLTVMISCVAMISSMVETLLATSP